MIIFDGDYNRIYRQMLDEDAKVKYYIDKLQGGIVKKFRQQRTFPIWHYEQITLPKSNNTYLIYYISARKPLALAGGSTSKQHSA